MGEVMGVLLDTPGWPHGQVWSSEELCREHAWARHVVGRRTGFEVTSDLGRDTGPLPAGSALNRR